MERYGILYLRNRTLPSLDDFVIHSRINNYNLVMVDEENFRPDISSLEESIHIILVDYPLRSRTRLKEIGEIKKKLSLPLIMLMVSVKESAQIDAFNDGADDIVDRQTGSGSVLTLINRIGNLIRVNRIYESEPLRNWKTGKDIITLNLSGRLVQVNGSPVHLTPTEWNILRLLSEKKGQVVSRENILASCFEYQYEGYDRSIDAHIKNLRKKTPGCIETMRGVGYRFNGKEI